MYKEIWSLFNRYDKKRTVIFIFILSLFTVISFIQPLISGQIAFYIQNGNHFAMCLLLFLLNIIMPAVANMLSVYNSELLTNIVKTDVQTDIFSSLVFGDGKAKGKTKGEIITILHSDISIILNIGKSMLSFSANVLSALIAAFGLLLFNPLVFLISVFVAPLIVLMNYKLNKNISLYSQNKYELTSSYKNMVNDIVFSYEEIKFQDSFEQIWHDVASQQKKMKINDIKCEAHIDSPGRVLDFINGIVPVIGYIVGVYFFDSDYKQLSLIITSTAYMTNFWSKISFISFIEVLSGPLINSLSRVNALLCKADAIISASPEMPGNKKILDFDKLVVKDLAYSYDGKSSVLSKFSVVFPSVGLVMLKGASGCGKTTLLKIILKECKAHKDSVFVDDVPLSQISNSSWYKYVGYMSQSFHLFRGTIRENIELFNPSYDERYICNLAEKLNIVSEIGSDFLDAALLEDNIGLSGGQKDRIGLLCVLSKYPRILLLDEPTNGLDKENILRFAEVLKTLKPKMLIICASHEACLAKYCDMVVSM